MTELHPYYLPDGDSGTCAILATVGDLLKVRDTETGAILFFRPEWLCG